MVPLAAPEGAPVSGWMSVTAPADVQIFENKRLIGTSQSDRLMVSAGKHDIEIVNDLVGYRTTRTVQVAAGRVTPIRVEFPKGNIALNAVPWAEVWVDGEKIGETQLGTCRSRWARTKSCSVIPNSASSVMPRWSRSRRRPASVLIWKK